MFNDFIPKDNKAGELLRDKLEELKDSKILANEFGEEAKDLLASLLATACMRNPMLAIAALGDSTLPDISSLIFGFGYMQCQNDAKFANVAKMVNEVVDNA